MAEDQAPQLAFLGDPRSYGLPPGTPVVRFDTHGAAVFLAGERAYKLKRAVKYSFMDFSTLARRRACCAAEIAVNRRTAPQLYLGIAPVLRRGGRLALGPVREPEVADEAEAIDWVVVLRRFDPEKVLDRVADRGGLDGAIVGALADSIARFHAGAEVRSEHGGVVRLAEAIATDIHELNARGEAVDRGVTFELGQAMEAVLARHADIVERRRNAGCVRHCHGDLHLGNVVLLDGVPVPFDAIEFNDRIACIDTLYDLAFLLMDLQFRRRADLANLALNRYLWRSPIAAELDLPGLGLLPLYMARRAAIRAHVGAANASLLPAGERDGALAKARAYQLLAVKLLKPAGPRLLAIGGLSGTGKTSLAMELAPALGGPAPGAVVLRSDVIRKRLAGIDLDQRMPAGSYTEAASARVYEELYRQVGMALDAGQSVIADAVFAQPRERAAIGEIARRRALPFDGLWLRAPLAVLQARVAARRGDASDATADVVARQAGSTAPPGDWHGLEASGDLAALASQALRALAIAAGV